MTLQELTHHFELKETLAKSEETLQSFQNAVCPGAQKLTGMPHVSGVRDRVGDLAVEIADMKDSIKLLKKEIEQEEQVVAKFISGIDDIQTRMIFRLRFVRGLSWKEVASIMGKKYSEESVKSCCYRYLCNLVTPHATP